MKPAYQPLDFVRTPAGSFAMIKEVSNHGHASVAYIGLPSVPEKTAWWTHGELTVIDSLPRVLAENIRHPFGHNQPAVEDAFDRRSPKSPI